jgi:2-dehydropantoate 2-reductase
VEGRAAQLTPGAVTVDCSVVDEGRRRICVVGTGAVGGYYGARLAAAGHEVHFVARSDHAHIATHGLRVDSHKGDLALVAVRVHATTATVPEVDVVVVATKTTANDALVHQLAPVLRPGMTVVMLQNGLGNEDAAHAAAVEVLGDDAADDVAVVAGLSFVCSHKVGPGHVHHLDYELVTVAPRVAPSSPGRTAAAAFAAELAGAGVEVATRDDATAARWHKLVWNVPFNGLAVVLDATTAELMATPATRTLAAALMREVQAAAATDGVAIADAFVARMLADTAKMTPYVPSTKLDFDRGLPMEIDAIYGAVVGAAARGGVDVGRIAALEAQLRFLDAAGRGRTRTDAPGRSVS